MEKIHYFRPLYLALDNVGRVIARPFVGTNAKDFKRTTNRHDLSLKPPRKTGQRRLGPPAAHNSLDVEQAQLLQRGRMVFGAFHDRSQCIAAHIAEAGGVQMCIRDSGETVRAVSTSKPPHFMTAAERSAPLSMESILLDAGCLLYTSRCV